jgi:hypothetical protein
MRQHQTNEESVINQEPKATPKLTLAGLGGGISNMPE